MTVDLQTLDVGKAPIILDERCREYPIEVIYHKEDGSYDGKPSFLFRGILKNYFPVTTQITLATLSHNMKKLGYRVRRIEKDKATLPDSDPDLINARLNLLANEIHDVAEYITSQTASVIVNEKLEKLLTINDRLIDQIEFLTALSDQLRVKDGKR
jgi:hypothetical protein